MGQVRVGLKAYFLGDTSAVARVAKPAVAQRLIPLIEAGLVARCTITDLEAGVSARNGRDWKRARHARSPWPQATIDQDMMDRRRRTCPARGAALRPRLRPDSGDHRSAHRMGGATRNRRLGKCSLRSVAGCSSGGIFPICQQARLSLSQKA